MPVWGERGGNQHRGTGLALSVRLGRTSYRGFSGILMFEVTLAVISASFTSPQFFELNFISKFWTEYYWTNISIFLIQASLGKLLHSCGCPRLPQSAGVEMGVRWYHIVQTVSASLPNRVVGWVLPATVVALEIVLESDRRLGNKPFLGHGSCGREVLLGWVFASGVCFSSFQDLNSAAGSVLIFLGCCLID